MDIVSLLIQTLNAVQYGLVLFLVASGLTLPAQAVWSAPVREWRERPLPALALPAVFALGA